MYYEKKTISSVCRFFFSGYLPVVRPSFGGCLAAYNDEFYTTDFFPNVNFHMNCHVIHTNLIFRKAPKEI